MERKVRVPPARILCALWALPFLMVSSLCDWAGTYRCREQNIDNLKAGVLRADWFDPELNPKLEEFARYYGTAILPTKPAMPRHKGKIESAVKYAQNNAVAGRKFTSLGEQNLFLAEWERTVADTRIYGTTR